MPNQAYCVLGMHRSGTSCLTGTLEEAGVQLGEVSRDDPSNPKGHHENLQIIALHKDVLHASGGSWYNPPRRIHWLTRHHQRRDELIARYADMPAWGFKDPRTVFTFEGWLAALPDLRTLAIFRHPLAVAQSLRKRDGFSLRAGLDLWARYNYRLAAYVRHYGLPLISFDDEEATFKHKMGIVLRKVGLKADLTRLTFFDPKLRHESPAGVDGLPREVAMLYQQLQRLAS